MKREVLVIIVVAYRRLTLYGQLNYKFNHI
jgi:hypothetical protein